MRPQLLLDLMEPCPHPVGTRMSLELKAPTARVSTDEDETQKLKRLRSPKTTPLSTLSRIPAKLQQTGLRPVQFESKLLEPLSHRSPKSPGIELMLKASNQIISVTHEDHLALGFSPAPLLGPEIEDVVKVDVRK